MKTPTGVSRAVAEKLTRAYKVGHDVGLKGWAPSVEAEQFKTKLEQRYFWLGVCDAQVEKNHRGAKNEDRNETSIRQRAAEARRDERD